MSASAVVCICSSRQPMGAGLQSANANLPINKSPTSHGEIREATASLKGEKIVHVACVELLKTEVRP